MKRNAFILILIVFGLKTQLSEAVEAAGASSELACGLTVAQIFKHEFDQPKYMDKFKHCAVSCVMTQYCGPVEAMQVGVLKEVMDALGFGEPDAEDLKADALGVGLGLKGMAKGRTHCYHSCRNVYGPGGEW